jgi:DNA polymerase I
MNIQFYLIDITYKIINNKPVIHLFGRTIDGKQVCVIDESFEPYFYVETDDIKNKSIEKNNTIYKITNTEKVKKNLNGRSIDLIKAYTNLPSAVPMFRDELKPKEVYEYDIPFVRRYLIDKKITPLTLVEAEVEPIEGATTLRASEVKPLSADTIDNPKILAFDIETYSPLGKEMVPEESPILMIAFYGDNYKKVITWKKFKTKEDIEFVESEGEMIRRFNQIINEQQPDIITGYFSDGFDFPYIKARANKLNIKLNIGLDNSDIKISKGRVKSVSVTGIIHLDVFKFVRSNMARSLKTDSLKLDSVAKELLGDQKQEVEIEKLFDAWDNNDSKMLEEFCKYNLHDSYLTYNLAKKILPNIIELVKIVGLPVDDVTRMAFSQLIEWYLIKLAPEFNELVPNKPHHDEIVHRQQQKFQGAFVFEPKPGLHNDIVIYDYRSLYPTIISSHNIAPSTLKCDCCRDNKVPGEYFWFCTKKKGFFSTVIENIIKTRMRIKEIMKKESNPFLEARQQSLKLLANSCYGYLGFYAARWYCMECAKSVTAYGRHYIKKVIAEAQEENFEVLYSDTDSVFLILNKKTKKDAMEFAKNVNKELPGMMELEYEGYYPAGIFVSAKAGSSGAKKRYALIDEDGDMKITGFEVVRRNISPITRKVQKTVFDIVLREKDPKKALEFVQGTIDKLRKKEIPLNDVIIFTQLQKKLNDYDQIGPHVAAAQRMLGKDIKVGPGTVVKYIIIQGNEKIRDRARLPEEVSDNDYDSDYYINNQIIPSVEKIFEILGYTKEDILENKSQNKLDKFF